MPARYVTPMMADAVVQEGEENEDRVLAALREAVRHLLARRDALDETLRLHLPEPTGEHARREASVVPKELPEVAQMEERHVPEDEKRPFLPEAADALPDWVRLVREKRVDFPRRLSRRTPARHGILPAPSGPKYYPKDIHLRV